MDISFHDVRIGRALVNIKNKMKLLKLLPVIQRELNFPRHFEGIAERLTPEEDLDVYLMLFFRKPTLVEPVKNQNQL